MSDEKKISENENSTYSENPQISEKTEKNSEIKLAVKKKRFKKSDILVFAICLVASILIWLYASNIDKEPLDNGQGNVVNPPSTEQNVENQ